MDLQAAVELPSLDPIIDFIKTAGTLAISAIMAIASIVLIFYIIKIGLRIKKYSGDGDNDERSKAIKDLIWVIVGFVITASASTIAGVFASVFIT